MISLPNVANSLGTAFFNSAHLAAMIGSVPRGDRGVASGMIHAAIDLCHMLGVSLGGLSLSLAFQYYAGLPGGIVQSGRSLVLRVLREHNVYVGPGVCPGCTVHFGHEGSGKIEAAQARAH